MKTKNKEPFSFGQKLLAGFIGAQFAAAFMKETAKIKLEKDGLSPRQLDYITKEIVQCSVYQSLINDGKTPKEISNILGIREMTSEKFTLLTGRGWPAK